MKKKIFVIFSVIVVVSVLILAFQALSPQKATPQKVTVLLDWLPNTNHTGIYVAKNKGYYTEENLDVRIIQPSGSESTSVVASGKADFSVSSQESVTLARAAKIPVVSIAAIIQHNTSAFASLKSTGIQSVKDFEGKRYGGWGSPIEEAALTAVMSDAGADYKKVKNITIGETDFFKTIGRESDFQWIFYGWDGIEAKRRDIALNTIMLKDLSPVLDYYTPVIITNEKHVQQQKDLVSRFMRATKKGYQYAIQYPNESANILIASTEINSDLVKKSQPWISNEYQADAPTWGVQKKEVWERYANWLYKHKLIKNNINAENAFTNDFLNDEEK